MTETGMSLGTPHYMSPEQATAEKLITARSDIYSLGSVLYEMLTGNPPHTGASAQQIIMKIVTEEAAPVTKLRKAVPQNVADAVAKSLEKLPADRFATAAEFARSARQPGIRVARRRVGQKRIQPPDRDPPPRCSAAPPAHTGAPRRDGDDCALGLDASGAGPGAQPAADRLVAGDLPRLPHPEFAADRGAGRHLA